ncbi:MAG: tRNA (N6-threonylcarbamoyladenosine(37)-N6)-methyltransferase TrmO [Deltaproteobacteria bacterium]|nr:tRNA (N6-threonylcarbamoyladenosine(37)-N6)-methyltransferase TrmO [Deltaproteobacteria bacterium]
MSSHENEFVVRPIGVIHTPFEGAEGTPIQGAFSGDAEGTVEVAAEYADGLSDLEGFSHVILLFAFHRSRGYALRVTPYLDDVLRGVFATRAPRRPNPIGLTVVKLVAVEGHTLRVAGVDMLDGTPLLDIKPYVPALDPRGEVTCGWLETRLEAARRGAPLRTVADERFHLDAEETPEDT